MYDAVIVGSGPAGLNAALTLGRARRRVFVVDGGPGRNAPSDAVHNFLTRDGIAPAELRTIGLKELSAYPSVEVRDGWVEHASGQPGDFRVVVAGGPVDGTREVAARRLLLATGVTDVLPDIPGLAERWGRGVVHCPYCHGFERSGLPLAVLAVNEHNVQLAVYLRRLSDDVVACTNAQLELTPDQRALLASRDIAVREDELARVDGDGTAVERLIFADGSELPRSALFFHPPTRQRSDLPARLGCAFLEDGSVEVNDFGQTTVPGVFAAGDMARRASFPLPGAQVVIAAAEGAIAGVVIDQELLYDVGDDKER